MKQSSGQPNNISRPILAKVTKGQRGLFHRKGYVLVGEHPPQKGYAALLTPDPQFSDCPGVGQLSPTFLSDDLADQDLVLIKPTGEVSVVWEAGCQQNSLLLTEACDCRCLMCPQIPQKHDPYLLTLAKQILDQLNPCDVSTLCITGGEPTLLKEQFVELLMHLKKKFPRTLVFVLTNAKGFADFDFAKRCALASCGQVQFCVSLHADNDLDHDKIVGAPGSFQKTVMGINNLARLRMPIEIRFVINRINVDRMVPFGDFVYRNFPFAVHVAFMAMEICGLAIEHIEKIWIDPGNYGEKVRFAANRLAMRGIPTSIYNLPLCLLPKNGWKFSRRSISDWKNSFLPQCQECNERDRCAGIFATSIKQSARIHPIQSVRGNP